jgi:hypothetical protein
MKYRLVVSITALSLLTLSSRSVFAHCDTMDGPVVKDARVALDSKDLAPVLKWIAPEKEGEIREAFQHALTVRALGSEARVLADRFFFETVVRVHREGEGEPYAGLKPAGTKVDPGIAASDEALETGSVDRFAKLLATKVDKGLRERYTRAAEARIHASESVEKGRAYVATYVAFMHYAERLHADASEDATHAGHGEGVGTAGPKEHSH